MPGRTLVSAALAASIGAALVSTLALYLNPGLVLRREAEAILICLFLPWTLAGTLLLALLAALATALGARRAFPPLIRRSPFFMSLAFVALSVAALLYWSNLLAYRDALPAEVLRALGLSAIVVTSAAAVLVAIALHTLFFPGRERAPAKALAILAPTLAVALPLALRPDTKPPAPVIPVRLESAQPARRIVVIGIDGLRADDLSEPSLAPVLSRLARRGALSTLRTLHPNEGPPLWTTLMTGRYPRDHGVLSATTYELAGSKSVWHLLPKGAGIGLLERAGLARRLPVASSARTRRAIWNVLDAFGMPTGLVRVWATQPPEAIQGFVVSPYFHLLSQDPARASSALHARDLLKEVAARMVKADDLDPALLTGFAEGAHGGAPPLDDPRLRSLAESALAPDLSYQRAAEVLSATYRPALLVLSFNGYDAVGHGFYREAHPEEFGDVRPEDARRYGRVLERYASLLGGYVTDWQKTLGPSDILVVVSAHGLEPTPLWRRLLGVLSGTRVASSSHEDAPEGLLLVVGEGIRPAVLMAGCSALDVTPTLLYLLGLPVARDMEGRVLTEILEPSFAREHPVTYIPSYEGLAVAPAVPGTPLDVLPPLPEE